MEKLQQVVTPETVARSIAEVGRRITADYAGKDLVLVGILKGATVFLADLLRAISGSVRFELVHLVKESGHAGEAVELSFATHFQLKGAHALILKDICHSGVTEQYLMTHLAQQGPASLEVAALIDRPALRRVALEPRYVVLGPVGEGRLVGCGMEYDGRWGNLPGIHELSGK